VIACREALRERGDDLDLGFVVQYFHERNFAVPVATLKISAESLEVAPGFAGTHARHECEGSRNLAYHVGAECQVPRLSIEVDLEQTPRVDGSWEFFEQADDGAVRGPTVSRAPCVEVRERIAHAAENRQSDVLDAASFECLVERRETVGPRERW